MTADGGFGCTGIGIGAEGCALDSLQILVPGTKRFPGGSV